MFHTKCNTWKPWITEVLQSRAHSPTHFLSFVAEKQKHFCGANWKSRTSHLDFQPLQYWSAISNVTQTHPWNTICHYEFPPVATLGQVISRIQGHYDFVILHNVYIWDVWFLSDVLFFYFYLLSPLLINWYFVLPVFRQFLLYFKLIPLPISSTSVYF